MKTSVSRKRHILKTLTWRIVGTLDTILISWLITGSIEAGIGIGGAEFITKTLLYYFHERIWYKFDFGITREDIDEDIHRH